MTFTFAGALLAVLIVMATENEELDRAGIVLGAFIGAVFGGLIDFATFSMQTP